MLYEKVHPSAQDSQIFHPLKENNRLGTSADRNNLNPLTNFCFYYDAKKKD